jgi:hypothetical protein
MEYKRASKYERGKIYKICSDDPAITDVYVGSTIQPLNQRMSKHTWGFKNHIPDCSSRILFERYGIDKFHIELIECYPCGTKKELLMQEQFYIDMIECVNESRSYRTNKQKIDYTKQYVVDNLETIRKTKRDWYQNNPDKVALSYQKNKQNILANKRAYCANHKDEKKAYDIERRKKRCICECGTELCFADNSKHIKSKKHINLMTALQQQQTQASQE